MEKNNEHVPFDPLLWKRGASFLQQNPKKPPKIVEMIKTSNFSQAKLS